MTAKLFVSAAVLLAASVLLLLHGGAIAVTAGALLGLLGLLVAVAGVGFVKDPQAVLAVQNRVNKTTATPAAVADEGADTDSADVTTAAGNRAQRRAAARSDRLRPDGKPVGGRR